MNKEIEKAIETLKKYHDLLLEVYTDYSVYSKAENYNDKSLELASRANAVKNACGTAITCMEQQLTNGWIPVSDRLPELKDGIISNKVLVAQGVNDKRIVLGWYIVNEWMTPDMIPFVKQELITHWMPLPEQPKGDIHE